MALKRSTDRRTEQSANPVNRTLGLVLLSAIVGVALVHLVLAPAALVLRKRNRP
jgi:hypothetical protein